MAEPYRVVHFLNQFFAGIGAEEQANTPVQVSEGPVGPGRALRQALGDEGLVVATVTSGDNYFNEELESALASVRAALREHRPDVVVAGPAFNAGRYGLACGEIGKLAESRGIRAVAAQTCAVTTHEPANPPATVSVNPRRSV